MKTPRMANAVGHIDDDLITAAAECKKKPNRWLKWGSVAACLLLAVAMILPMLKDKHGNPSKPDKLNDVGAILQTGDGTLTYHTDKFREHIVAFTIVLKNEIPSCYVVFSADTILHQWTDSEGITHMENQLFKVITPCTSYEIGIPYSVVDDALSITVNGEKATTMPTTPGTYEIVIDYSELYNRFDIVDENVDVWPFGDININSERVG